MSVNLGLLPQQALPETDVYASDRWTKVRLPFPELCAMCKETYTRWGEKPPAALNWDPRVVVPGCLTCRVKCRFNDRDDALQVIDGGLATPRRMPAASGTAS